jgi:hypothetical protein
MRPMLREVVSLWPAGQRGRLALWIRRDEAGRPQIRARLRDHDFDLSDAAREVRRIRNDVAMVFELDSGRTVTAPWRSLDDAS